MGITVKMLEINVLAVFLFQNMIVSKCGYLKNCLADRRGKGGGRLLLGKEYDMMEQYAEDVSGIIIFSCLLLPAYCRMMCPEEKIGPLCF